MAGGFIEPVSLMPLAIDNTDLCEGLFVLVEVGGVLAGLANLAEVSLLTVRADEMGELVGSPCQETCNEERWFKMLTDFFVDRL